MLRLRIFLTTVGENSTKVAEEAPRERASRPTAPGMLCSKDLNRNGLSKNESSRRESSKNHLGK